MNRKFDWLREAEAELRTAQDLHRLGHYAWACFTALQSAEKALQAVLLHVRDRPTTHDMVDLLKPIVGRIKVPGNVVQAAIVLNRYYVATRCPDSFSSGAPAEKYSETDAKEATDLAKLVYDFCSATLGPAGPSAP